MKTKIKILSIALVCGFCFTPNAKAFELNVYGGANFSNINLNAANGTSLGSKMGMTYGAGIGWSAMPGFSLEADVFLTKRKLGVGPTVSELSAQYLEIPVIFKATLIPMVSLGVGLYYASSLSDKLISSAGGVDTEKSFGTYNWKQSDLGWLLAASGKLPIAPTLSFKVDVRYYMSLAGISTDPSRSEKWSGFETLGGLSFGF